MRLIAPSLLFSSASIAIYRLMSSPSAVRTVDEWCSGYVTRSWVLCGVTSAVICVSLIYFVFASYRENERGCPMMRKLCSGNCIKVMCCDGCRADDVHTLVRTDGSPPSSVQMEAVQTVPVIRADGAHDGNGSADSDEMIGAFVGTTTTSGLPVMRPPFTIYLSFAVRNAVLLLLALQPVMGRFSGRETVLFIIMNSTLSSMEALSVDMITRRHWRMDRRMEVASVVVIILLMLSAAYLLTCTFFKDAELWAAIVGVSAFVSLTTISVGLLMLGRICSPRNRSRIADNLAAIFLFLLGAAGASLTLYTAITPIDDREHAAVELGCFGNIQRGRNEIAVFYSHVVSLATSLMYLVFAVPDDLARSPRKPQQRPMPTLSFFNRNNLS